MKSLYMVSLGCPKNLVDSEVMLHTLERAGYVAVEEPDAADLLLVNTCGFIQSAVEEALDTILELAQYKQENPGQQLVVTGCMVQRYQGDLLAELPEVDLFVGLDDFAHLDLLLQGGTGSQLIVQPGSGRFLMNSSHRRRLATPPFRAYLKITEGCDNRCSYCMIPSIRGPRRSRSMEDLLIEARELQARGVRELSLVAQDLTAYGQDLSNQVALVDLLESLLDQTTFPWIRLLYAYPSGISDALLRCMATQTRILPYIDVPFQHVSDPVLRRMNRHYTEHDLNTLIERIRTHVPHCALRTTFMVGFPGETDHDVAVLLAALQRWRLDHVGVFQYQDEEGSPAFLLPEKVEEAQKEARYAQVMGVQAEISAKQLRRYVGRVEPVLVEGVSEESELLLEGRSRYQAPEIDGCVYITSGQVSPGDIVPVRITEAHTYDLVGEVEALED